MDRSTTRQRRYPWLVVSSLLLCASVAGCGAGKAEVRGAVRYNGRPLPFGTIQFLGSDGVPCAAPIGPDGTFTARLPAGKAKVIVRCVDEAQLNRFTSQQAAAAQGRAAPPPLPVGGFSYIPQRYTNWDGSGLTVLVQGGRTTHDFDLTSN